MLYVKFAGTFWKNAGDWPAGQAAVTAPALGTIAPETLLTQLSMLNAFVHRLRAAPVSVFEPLNVKLSRRMPRLNSHLSVGRNSSVSELDQNCGTTWLYVAWLPFSASMYAHCVVATPGSGHEAGRFGTPPVAPGARPEWIVANETALPLQMIGAPPVGP